MSDFSVLLFKGRKAKSGSARMGPGAGLDLNDA
jgi:hypothetical protein